MAGGGLERSQTTKKATDLTNNLFSMFSNLGGGGSAASSTQPRTAAPLPNVTGANSSSGDFFIRVSLDLLQNSKDYRRNSEQLRTAIPAALDALDHPETANALAVFKPFQIACHSGSPELITISIDCLGKLFTYNYWKFAANVHVEQKDAAASSQHDKDTSADDGDNDGTSEMITFVIDTICDGFVGESTDEKVQLQIIKALQAALTNADPVFSLHGGILLKAIRTTYNIFLLSKSNDVQTVAQGTVTQMVQNVLSRIPNKPTKLRTTADPIPASAEVSVSATGSSKNLLDLPGSSSTVLLSTSTSNFPMIPEGGQSLDREFKDAFKVFRTLCVLSVKAIPNPEGTIELRSQPIRSKLLALHLLSTVLQSHAYLFSMIAIPLWELVKEPSGTKETFRFVDSVKEFLVLSLSRNATSMILPIFEVSMEMFGRLWVSLRSYLKKEMAVFFTEIVIPILEARKNIPWYQRHSLLKSLTKIFSDPTADGGQMWVEVYLNYDCDVEATAKENIWERLMNALAKITSQHVNASPNSNSHMIQCYQHQGHNGSAPALTTNNLLPLSREQVKELFSVDGDADELRKQGVALMATGVMKPLVEWCLQRVSKPVTDSKKSDDKGEDDKLLGLIQEQDEAVKPLFDDPTAIGFLKQKKQHLIEGIKKFNTKPKKGIQYLLETGCITTRTPKEIAKFLVENEGLNKAMIGEFLGEGEEENIAIMHSFVEEFEFVNSGFVDALRAFLQSFRLPGESQKIDRFMLKFAEIYLKGNPEAFSSADTAYVLAYSVIMLNTDQHNSQVKRRMTKGDFIKNNRGIDSGKDLAEDILSNIFEEIATNEIIMKDEAPTKAALQAGKDPQNTKKTLSETSESMALKTEKMMRKGTTRKAALDDKASPFITASHYAHVKPMFELIWMAVLTGLSTPLQEGEEVSTVMGCLEGIKQAIKITCIFDLELERNALLSTLGKFTLLNNIHEMREKNFEAIRTLLEIAYQEGDHLGVSWKDVVSCISQLEKLQIVGEGNGQSSQQQKSNDGRKREGSSKPGQSFIEEAAAVASSQGMTLIVDKIFSASARLSGTAIVHFVRSLCEVSWDEITTSVDKDQPRMYCLQRLVEISYYNMKRIRVEWSNIWAILGQHFNQVGCYPNTNVALFALDKLRQLALKFLELEELPNFKFQKDFLRPFEEIVKNNSDPKIKDMCLVCLQQIIQAKGNRLKSGWKTLCVTIIRVAREVNEPLVNLGFDITKSMMKHNFDSLVNNGSLSDFVACLVEFCKNRKAAKVNLSAMEALKQCAQKISDITATKLSQKNLVSSPSMIMSLEGNPAPATTTTQDTTMVSKRLSTMPSRGGTLISNEEDICIRYWMPLLFGLHDVIMTCDLETRTRGLTFLFETLKAQGGTFSISFWELLAKGVLFPIFDDMKQTGNANVLNSKFANKEELSVWLSTTLIAALRQFVDLFTHYFQTIGFMLKNMFDLLKICLMHENEALSRIGSTCIQQLVEQNAARLSPNDWKLLGKLFVDLFDETSPTFLFFNYNGDPALDVRFQFLKKPLGSLPDKKDFQKQINKCVQHLMVVQTLQDVLSTGNDTVYKQIPNDELLILVDCLNSSYILAHTFNESMELRAALYKMGYMKQLPNLLKQETLSVNAYLIFLIKIFQDTLPHRQDLRGPTQARLIPLCLDIINQYNSFDSDASKQRSINAWRPVVVVILSAFSKFDDDYFKQHIQKFYPPAIKLLLQEMTPDVRVAIYNILCRAGNLFGLGVGEKIDAPPISMTAPIGIEDTP